MFINTSMTFSFEEILFGLNESQSQAVTSTEGPLLVLAGAGTGKTRVLTTRIAYILHEGLAFPSQILAVTFTNKAAKEMESRIHQMVGDVSAGLWLGTFHSICLRMIRKHCERLDLDSTFAIINSDDQLRLMKTIMKEMNIDEKRFNPKAVTAQINRWKDRALEPDEVVDGDVFGNIYEVYYQRCKTLNVVDFGDLMMKAIKLLKNNPDVLEEYQRRFKYILVDEYQDTNIAQYLWLRLLSQDKHNICCVGDDDQSIYGWRGAEIENILRFEKDFEEANIVRLEINYRSTQEILSTADKLISNNNNRLGKNLKAHNEAGGQKVKLVSIWDDRGEAKYIANEIESLQQLQGVNLNDIAILVRAGHQTRSFEECFVRNSIPYRILGGLRFYERMEIRDAVAYIRSVIQPSNDLALERIINIPKRGIGKKTLDEIRFQAREQGISLNQAIRGCLISRSLKPKIHSVLQDLFDNFDKWAKALAENENHADAVNQILDESGYKQMWEDEKTIEAKGRLENLKELLSALSSFRDIDEFLEHVSLVSDADDRPLEDMVSIMTIHGAKGLEFENLFLPGWEEGLFPSQQTLDENGKDGLEEERRLAYVAITRAKKRLQISFASSRMVFGNIISSIPSRFIDELDPQSVEAVNNGSQGAKYQGAGKKFGGGNNQAFNSRFKDKGTVGFVAPSADNNYKGGVAKKENKFSVGDKVTHQTFGVGRVLNVKGKHLQIVFEKSAIKTLVDDFVEAA